MSQHEPPLTDPALLALLCFDAGRDTAPAAKARVLDRVETTIGVLGGVMSHPASATVDRGGRASPIDSAQLSQTRALRSPPSLRTMLHLAGQPVGMIVAAFLIGGAGGAGLHAALAPPRERTVYIERPIAVPEPRPFVFDSFNQAPNTANRDNETAESSKMRAIPAPAVSGLTAERQLLDRARKALARGDTEDAERALGLHARRHSVGLLVEEREALAIKVMVDTGRTDEARRRAAKFTERYPRSLFGPTVEEAIGTIR